MVESIDDSPRSDTAERPVVGTLPLWRMYLYAVGSFGLFLPFWVHRVARQQGAGQERRSTPVWWALGSVVAPPVAMALLYQFSRNATSDRGGERRSRRTALVPALSWGALCVLWVMTPLVHLKLIPVLLLPVPFVLVQAAINRSARGTETEQPAGSLPGGVRTAFQLGAAVVGLLVFGWAAWSLDRGQLRFIASTGAEETVVQGSSKTYELRLPGGSWMPVERGTYGDDSDLELRGPGSETWVVSYVFPGASATIESTVGDRRAVIFETGEPLLYDESRHFLPDADLVPTSIATYRVRQSFGVDGWYVVLTAQSEKELVEVIGYTALQSRVDLLRDLVTSFRFSVPSEP